MTDNIREQNAAVLEEMARRLRAGKSPTLDLEGWDVSLARWVKEANVPYMALEGTYALRYRPRTVTIGAHEIPEPIREAPKYETRYWVVLTTEPDEPPELVWRASEADTEWLHNGLIHLSRDAAVAHAHALLQFTRRGEG